MIEYTSLEVSERIQAVGVELHHRWGWANSVNGYVLVTKPTSNGAESRVGFLPAYTAQQAFDWLREWTGNEEICRWFKVYDNCVEWYDNSILTIPEVCYYKTNLADMLWEAIIWIKENEV